MITFLWCDLESCKLRKHRRHIIWPPLAIPSMSEHSSEHSLNRRGCSTSRARHHPRMKIADVDRSHFVFDWDYHALPSTIGYLNTRRALNPRRYSDSTQSYRNGSVHVGSRANKLWTVVEVWCFGLHLFPHPNLVRTPPANGHTLATRTPRRTCLITTHLPFLLPYDSLFSRIRVKVLYSPDTWFEDRVCCLRAIP